MPQVGERSVRHDDALAMEIEPHAGSAAGGKSAAPDRAVFRMPESKDGIALALHDSTQDLTFGINKLLLRRSREL